MTVHVSFHAQIVATAARSAAVDALIAGRRVDPSVVAAELARWQDGPGAPITSVSAPALSTPLHSMRLAAW